MPSWLTRAACRASARNRSKKPRSPRYSSFRILVVVEEVGNAFGVDQSRVPGLCPEPLQKARVAEILVLQDLDGAPATNEDVCGLPHFTHATNGNARLQLVTTPECEPWAWSHFFSTASSTFFAI